VPLSGIDLQSLQSRVGEMELPNVIVTMMSTTTIIRGGPTCVGGGIKFLKILLL
jgi:hypothetical protein